MIFSESQRETAPAACRRFQDSGPGVVCGAGCSAAASDGMDVENHRDAGAQTAAARPAEPERGALVPIMAQQRQLDFLLKQLANQVLEVGVEEMKNAIFPVVSKCANRNGAPRSSGYQFLALVELTLQQLVALNIASITSAVLSSCHALPVQGLWRRRDMHPQPGALPVPGLWREEAPKQAPPAQAAE